MKTHRRTIVVGLILASAVWLARRSPTTPRIATFNIERFGADNKRTDGPRLVALIDSLQADVLAVQEIEDGEKFARVVAALGGGKRHYAARPNIPSSIHVARARVAAASDPDLSAGSFSAASASLC